MREEIKNELAKWFIQAQQAMAKAAEQLNLPTSIPSNRMGVKNLSADGRSFSGEQLKSGISILNSFNHHSALIERTIFPARETLAGIAQQLIERYGSKCNYWSGHPGYPEILSGFLGVRPRSHQYENPPSFANAPENWVIGKIFGGALQQYLADCDDLALVDQKLLSTVLNDLLDFVADDNWTIVEEFPLAGIVTTEELSFKEISLLVATPDEQAYWSTMPMPGLSDRRSRPFQMTGTFAPTHILRVVDKSPKSERPVHTRRGARMLIALQLLGMQPSSTEFGDRMCKPRWSATGKYGVPSGLPERCEFVNTLSREQFETAVDLSGMYTDAVILQPRSAQEIAVHKFHTALRRTDLVDALLDLNISLEAIFLPGESTEVSHRFRLNGAMWLDSEPEQRNQIYRELKAIYTARSKMVHGAKFPSHEELKTLVASAKALTQKSIFKALTQGWPVSEDFLQLCLHNTVRTSFQ